MNRHLNLIKESDIETKLKKRVTAIGGEYFKFTSPGNPGVPDGLTLHNGNAYFAECKRPKGGVYSALQLNMRKRFAKHNVFIHSVTNDEELDTFIEYIKNDTAE